MHAYRGSDPPTLHREPAPAADRFLWARDRGDRRPLRGFLPRVVQIKYDKIRILELICLLIDFDNFSIFEFLMTQGL